MEEAEKKQVYRAIRLNGDEFWNDWECKHPERWNGFLFDEILAMLNEEGLDLKLVKK